MARSAPTNPPARRTQAERVADARQRLLDAAVELIIEKGYEATSAAEIGVRAGLSRAMVGVRFGTKEDLLDQLLHERYEDRIVPDSPPDVPGIEQALGVLDGLIDLARTQAPLLRAIFVLNFEAAGNAATLRPRMSAWMQRIEARLVEGLTHGIEDGSVRPDIDPRRSAREALHTGIGIAYTWIVLPDKSDFAAEVAELRARLNRELTPTTSA